MADQGLRVLSFAVRPIDEQDVDVVTRDPMAFARDLVFVRMGGIIDPLRPAAKRAVATALEAVDLLHAVCPQRAVVEVAAPSGSAG